MDRNGVKLSGDRNVYKLDSEVDRDVLKLGSFYSNVVQLPADCNAIKLEIVQNDIKQGSWTAMSLD